jgi:hypothetical protein
MLTFISLLLIHSLVMKQFDVIFGVFLCDRHEFILWDMFLTTIEKLFDHLNLIMHSLRCIESN